MHTEFWWRNRFQNVHMEIEDMKNNIQMNVRQIEGWGLDETGSGMCLMADFDVSGVEPAGSATRKLTRPFAFWLPLFCFKWKRFKTLVWSLCTVMYVLPRQKHFSVVERSWTRTHAHRRTAVHRQSRCSSSSSSAETNARTMAMRTWQVLKLNSLAETGAVYQSSIPLR
jgi:hypothetical protein